MIEQFEMVEPRAFLSNSLSLTEPNYVKELNAGEA
jgi:hypothetical protein